MSTFQTYLKGGENSEYAEKQLRIIDKITLSEEAVNKLMSLQEDINILAVDEVYYPDCRTINGYLEKFSQINEKIKIRYATREEAKEILLKASGQTRIPTLFLDKGTDVKLILTEFPKAVIDDMKKNPENFDEIKYSFRTGKYNEKIEKELLNSLFQ